MDQSTTTYDQRTAGTTPPPAGPADAAKQQAGEVATTAADEAARVASTAKDGVVDLTGTVKEQVSTVTSDVAEQGKNLLAGAKDQVTTTADDQVSKVSGKLGTFTDQLQALLDGRPEDAGQVKDIASRAIQEVNGLASRIDQKGVEGVLEDVRSFARRKPGTFLLLAGAAGLGVGLVARGAKAQSGQQVQLGQQSYGTSRQLPTMTTPPTLAELPPLPPITSAEPTTDPWLAGNTAGRLR